MSFSMMPPCLVKLVLQYLPPDDLAQMNVVARFLRAPRLSMAENTNALSLVDNTAGVMLRMLCPEELLPLFDDYGGVKEYRKFMNGPQVCVHLPTIIGNGPYVGLEGRNSTQRWNTASVCIRERNLYAISDNDVGVASSFHCRNSYTVMREGIHFASFEITSPSTFIDENSFNASSNAIGFGVMRPVTKNDLLLGIVPTSFDITTLENSIVLNDSRTVRWSGDVDYVFIQPAFHHAVWGRWGGSLTRSTSMITCSPRPKERIGLLLNLNVGTLSLYVDGKFAGTVKNGLSGDYVWMVYSSTQLPRRESWDPLEDIIVEVKKY